MKKVFIALMCMASLMIMTACGGGNKNNNATADGKAEVKKEAKAEGKKWPATEYTKLIPEPEGATVYEEHAIDNNYFAGHNITVTDWSIEECKAYAAKLQEMGFTTPGAGATSVVVTDNGTDYSFGAKNSDGVYVTVGTRAGKSGGISIQVQKNN